MELHRGNAARALELLQPVSPFELSTNLWGGVMYPVYVRGETYLAAHDGRAAAGEFQKIVNRRAFVANRLAGALAHLGLARACALSRDNARSRASYQDFLALWKDADPDVPVLKQAKAEYAKLQ